MSAIRTVTASLAALALAGSAAIAQQQPATGGAAGTAQQPATGAASGAMSGDSTHNMAGGKHSRKASRRHRGSKRAAGAMHDSSAMKGSATSTPKPR